MSCVDAYYNHVMCMCVLCVSIICTVHVKETLTNCGLIAAKLQYPNSDDVWKDYLNNEHFKISLLLNDN